MSRADTHSHSDGSSGYEAVPDEFQERDQWLLWDAAADTPRRPHWRGDFGVSWSNPDCWHTFEDAIEAAAERESWGIGYVMAAGNDDHPQGAYACIDIDGAYVENGELQDWVPDLRRFIEAGSYIEYSPSGTGLHIPIEGRQVPEWWSDSQIDDHEGIDVLSNKFCTFTGDSHPESGATVVDVNPAPWLFEAYKNLQGEAPRLTDATNSDEYDGGEYLEASDIENALSHIDPDLPHTEWVKVAYAVHDFDAGSTGKSLFESWSKQGEKWDDSAKRSVDSIWNGATSGSGVTVGTLIHKARGNGWELPTPGREPQADEDTDKPLAEAIDGSWFDSDRKVVSVYPSADLDADRVADLFENPDALPTDAILVVNETPGGSEFLADPEAWSVERGETDPWADVRLLFGTEGGNAPATNKAAQLLLEDKDVLTEQEGGSAIYLYENGVYRTDGAESKLRKYLNDANNGNLGSQGTRRRTDNIINTVRDSTTVPRERIGGPAEKICVQNGVVDLSEPRSPELLPHSPEYHFTRQLGTEFDPSAECPRWKQFVGETVRPEDIPKVKLYAGYLLLHWGQPFKKALMLLGPTDSGKTTLANVLTQLLGPGNVAGESLYDLSTSSGSGRWAEANLVGKLANVNAELDSDKIPSVGRFKALTGNESQIRAERKGEDPFEFANTAKFIFACNRTPNVGDADDAFYRRLLLVSTPRSIPESNQDKQLKEKLIAELTGILNWAIEGYAELVERGEFTNERPTGAKRDFWEAYSDPVSRFKQACLEVTANPDDCEPKRELYNRFLDYCEAKGLGFDGQQTMFTQELTAGEKIGQSQRRLNGDRKYVFTSVQFDGDAFDRAIGEAMGDPEVGNDEYGLVTAYESGAGGVK